ncbi:MAG: hypothetical protein R3336_06185, partial [Phycisphaeraceae bacterium]|nr:hypothetical protein [Phycisphaeraceae bacterium]
GQAKTVEEAIEHIQRLKPDWITEKSTARAVDQLLDKMPDALKERAELKDHMAALDKAVTKARTAKAKPDSDKPSTATKGDEGDRPHPQERSAKRILDLGKRLEEAGKVDIAERRYEQIVERFEGTRASKEAARRLERIRNGAPEEKGADGESEETTEADASDDADSDTEA